MAKKNITLYLDEEVIKRAKIYAAVKSKGLSSVVENLLLQVINENEEMRKFNK